LEGKKKRNIESKEQPNFISENDRMSKNQKD
jgi:hypothetical protein